MITDERLQEWKGLCEKATEGPWELDDRHVMHHREHLLLHPADCYDDWYVDFTTEDCEFIATARTAMPELIAEVQRLRGLIQHAPHAITCNRRPYSICQECGVTFAGHLEGGCLNHPTKPFPEGRWAPDDTVPCDCWKAALTSPREVTDPHTPPSN